MADDFLLEPDELELDRPDRSRPVRLVSSGLAPTAALPPGATKGPGGALVYQSCVCGTLVLQGACDNGEVLVLDPSIPIWCVVWEAKAALPRLCPSRGYIVHTCKGP